MTATDALADPAPRWFTIPAHRPFALDLARGLLARLPPGHPEQLAEALVLVPTRRAARTLAEAFVEAAAGQALLLPQIRPLGDLDEGEPPFEPGDMAMDLLPAVSPWRRRFELARLAADFAPALGRELDAVGALEMGDALARFLDSAQIEEAVDLAQLDDWVAAELAKHWAITADFLRLAAEAWPQRLAELNLVDVTARRVALTRRLAQLWRESPPKGPVFAAGSTGSAPATADLLHAVAQSPRGCVILPGLDQELADAAWAEVDEPHPQNNLRRLLARAGIERGAVKIWPASAAPDSRGRWRRRLVDEALRPPKATADWLGQIAGLRQEGAAAGVDPIAEGVAGLSVIAARDEQEAATACALALRETLETPGATAALITPDQALARRVSARLARWGIVAEPSAGQPLSLSPTGQLITLTAWAATDALDPVTLLALVKHPLARLGLEAEALVASATRLERRALRGARPRDAAALDQRLAAEDEAVRDLLARLRAALGLAAAPFAAGLAEPADAARALAGAVEALAAGPAGGTGRLWAGPDGEAAARLASALIQESQGLPPTDARGFAELVEALVGAEVVRAGPDAHPRLRILGTLEARLVRADRLVLAGLEEGVWPAPAPVDPFLSRPMRKAAGLPPPERRIGLSAHDFAQAACAPEVIIIHSERRGGAPAVASRWLWRLRTLAKGAGRDLPGRPELLDWVRALDAPIEPAPPNLRTAPRPRPTPPVAVRPRKLPVTGVERWVRDPYAIYARLILGLRPLERPGEAVDVRARGTAIHAAFETFARAHPEALPPGAEAIFEAMLVEALADAGMPPANMAREAALAANVAPWVAAFEARRRPGARLLIEQSGELTLTVQGRPFTVTAKADRIEHRGAGADILDFKTGMPPSARQVQSGLSPQLTLTAAILHRGGFADIGQAEPGELVYVQVSGGRTPGREDVRARGGESLALAEAALEGLVRRVAQFDREQTPYVAWAAPQFIDARGGDYDHLARLWEWHVIGEADAEGGE